MPSSEDINQSIDFISSVENVGSPYVEDSS